MLATVGAVMDVAVASLLALVAAIALGVVCRVNVGILALILAYVVGVGLGGMPPAKVTAGFPSGLFLTLAGITSLFAVAQANGSLALAAQGIERSVGNRSWSLPIVFYVASLVTSTVGAGNIAAAALLAPPAMAVAVRRGTPQFIMALAIGMGANAGALSPISPTGVVANDLLARNGLQALGWQIYLDNLIAHTIVAATAYLLLRGWRHAAVQANETSDVGSTAPGWSFRHALTLGVVVTSLIVSVIWTVDLAWAAFAGFAVLIATRLGDQTAAFKLFPVNAVLMITGVVVLVEVMQVTGGTDALVHLIAGASTTGTLALAASLVAGLMSTFSSSSGVVLPALLPTVPGLIEHVGGGDARAIAGSIIVGAHLVDVSPFSTIGALCLAAAPEASHGGKLFVQMTLWGIAMVPIGAIVCYILL